jgi:hypothetical protein
VHTDGEPTQTTLGQDTFSAKSGFAVCAAAPFAITLPTKKAAQEMRPRILVLIVVLYWEGLQAAL